ncbi:hypothetical protein Q3G72_010149 [Acer saccharum]|nr:hypothetical protein Q3G72_010149 [Acer saccharum]
MVTGIVSKLSLVKESWAGRQWSLCYCVEPYVSSTQDYFQHVYCSRELVPALRVESTEKLVDGDGGEGDGLS